MTANTSLLLSNPDFPSIRGSLVAFLKSQDRFKDYDFAGSNLSVILDLLAYNSYQDAYLTSMVASEMFMDTAQLRSSIVSHAKVLGYSPRSATAAKAIVTVEVFPTDSPGTLIIPKGQVFTTSIGSRAFTFQTLQPYMVVPVGGRYLAPNVEIFEGFSITEVYSVDQSILQAKYPLSNKQADTSTLYVTVNGDQHLPVSSILQVDSRSKLFFIQENASGVQEIFFGDSIIGAKPVHQATIKAQYLVTAGDEANGAAVFRNASTIGGYTSITTTTTSVATGGAGQESAESVRYNAPALYQARNRAVTVNDYRALLINRFPEIEAVNVYGGEELTPPQFGKVFICVSTTNDDIARTTTAKTEYYRFIKDRSPVTIQPTLVDPELMTLSIASTVYYDYINYQVSARDVEAAVIAAINTFNTTLTAFNSTFAYSQLTTDIDKSSTAIISNDTTILMGIALDIGKLETESQKLYFRNALTQKSVAVSSTPFLYNGKSSAIVDDELGSLYIVSGTQLVTKIGSVDYDAGIVTVDSFLPGLLTDKLTIYTQPASKNISASQNLLLSIDTTSAQITAVPLKNQ